MATLALRPNPASALAQPKRHHRACRPAAGTHIGQAEAAAAANASFVIGGKPVLIGSQPPLHYHGLRLPEVDDAHRA